MADRASYEEHFFRHNWKTGPPPRSVTDACHWCQIRLFPTHDRFPVTIVNKTGDGARFPASFRFITQSVLTPGVEAAATSFRSGCSCASAEACKYEGCACLEDMEWEEGEGSREESDDDSDSDSEGDGESGSGSGSGGVSGSGSGNSGQKTSAGRQKHSLRRQQLQQRRRRAKFAYHSRGPRAGLLRGRLLDSRDPIYECHDGCACREAAASASTAAPTTPSPCANRVVERGRQIPLQIFRTTDRGWGMRTLQDLERGQFIDRYVGEVLTAREAGRRRSAASMARRKDVYLFALDKFSDAQSLDQRLAGPPLEVDGEFRSGPTRFINHACRPNLRIFARVGDHADKHIHDLAFFAVRAINAGEELTFDYTGGSDATQLAEDARRRVAGMTQCLCGSDNCRGFLW